MVGGTLPMTGTVAEFDEGRGLGAITSAEGVTYPFHCTQIADGSRRIDVGRAVRFDLLAKLGRYEATAIEKV
jgi:cold shock CspA family protein